MVTLFTEAEIQISAMRGPTTSSRTSFEKVRKKKFCHAFVAPARVGKHFIFLDPGSQYNGAIRLEGNGSRYEIWAVKEKRQLQNNFRSVQLPETVKSNRPSGIQKT
jgi:hypothetical protein